jgi:CelD/BcsL family acetyltransferase involved in cellulose biosynthesis
MAGSKQHSTMEPMLITDPGGIAEIEDEWRELAELRSNAFVSPEWFRSWWAHQRGSASALIVAVHRSGGALAGVMPLVLDTSHRPHAIRFAGATLGDRFHPAAAADEEGAVASAAMRILEQQGLDRHLVLLEHIDPERSWWREMQAASLRRRAAVEQQQTALTYIPLEGLDWEGYVASRSKNFRRHLRRRERALRRDHRVHLHAPTEASLEADLDRFFDLHALRWRERGSSSLEAKGAKEVLRSFAAEAQRRGWLRLRLLEVDGAAVAAFFGWRLGDVFAFYQQGFDPAWSRRSVGVVIAAVTIREAIEEGANEFDFLLGTEAYKSSFTTTARPGATIVLTRAMHPTRLLIAGEARARRAIAGRPALGRVVRSLARLVPTPRRS